MASTENPTNYVRERKDRLIQEGEHDPYFMKRKIAEPNVCPDCEAIYSKGRWSWGSAPSKAHSHRCPACQRVHDRVPAAFLTLQGPFFAEHEEEIAGLINNIENREKQSHPLKRIMNQEKQEDKLLISFTDAHLARNIGDAIHHAYKGELDVQYNKGDMLLRVSWSR